MILLGCPPKATWFKPNGVIQCVIKALELNGKKASLLCSQVFNQVLKCMENEYDNLDDAIKRERKKSFDTTSEQAQILADLSELGCSQRTITTIINRFRVSNSQSKISRTTVRRCNQNMKPLICALRKLPQGNRNKGSKWAIA